MKKLELAWEAVQDIYTTYANIYAYRFGLKTFCSFGEQTYLIKIAQKKIQAFYDPSEQNSAEKNGQKDFLNPAWRKIFKNKAKNAIDKAKRYTKRYHLQSADLPKKELFSRIKEGTDINNELFTAFAACQPQYTSLVEKYIKGLMSDSLSPDDRDRIFFALVRSEKLTPLNIEEIEWAKIVKSVKESRLQTSDLVRFLPFLERHAIKFGLLRAADGLAAWTKKSLLDKLKTELESKKPNFFDGSNVEKIKSEKEKVVREHKLDNNIVELCDEVAELSHLRLCLRLEGWMPVSYILIQELFPQLPKYLPYMAGQLECTVPEELSKIFEGDYSIGKGELDNRYNLIFYGLMEGEEVRWSGNKAKEMVEKLISPIDTSTKEVRGQVSWKGKVTGKCFVLRWDSPDVIKEMEEMPEGAVLVVGQTRPQLMTAIKKASAIVTDEGGLLSHAAIISRELGKPSVIGTKFATKIFRTGDLIKVDADKGVVKVLNRKNAKEVN